VRLSVELLHTEKNELRYAPLLLPIGEFPGRINVGELKSGPGEPGRLGFGSLQQADRLRRVRAVQNVRGQVERERIVGLLRCLLFVASLQCREMVRLGIVHKIDEAAIRLQLARVLGHEPFEDFVLPRRLIDKFQFVEGLVVELFPKHLLNFRPGFATG